MENYKYHTDQFGINENEIHFLRSSFPYQKIGISDIQRIEIKEGIRTKNKYGLALFGFINIAISIWFIYFIVNAYSYDIINSLANKMTYVLGTITLMFIGFGGVCLYNAFVKTTILIVRTKDLKWSVFSLFPIIKSNQLNEFMDFLKTSEFKKYTKVDLDQRKIKKHT